MEYILLKETTLWNDTTTLNHTYILSPNKEWMYGYIPLDRSGKARGEYHIFSGRRKFYPARRKFVVDTRKDYYEKNCKVY
ncbi:hypothetical protein UFOVP1666_195 [uncultured Caudovirales phage]|uniref:Uncharacterized protein n=1 Tax=uncultured Caudovirales phage TaxID=2100421 RepID=A0A6J5T6K0_9CAUD|nr:hypothetical protein UFOVP867_150 [uncultured Caudovirales phage]CAB4170542.1 hypothetical protein UFOVP913_48 [uncultured Caudovirales phage]CAB4176961.1 hypothetical protein UFOVP993_101 [uncultured Caudovirales phage]CAB4223405.1 hypothetical protein UFOVP1666_195 [uncultured Caudovirales phage]